jgi:ATP-dependent Clp protease ATP-binding subunit ClpA
VVCEISDIDHAAPDVRSALADLFLMILETGEAQSAKGNMFSCAQLILAFTMNLPEGKDETVLKGLGFGGAPSWREVQRRVSGEIKDMLSSAFLSRVGTPVVFRPLDEEALATVVERAIDGALRTAAERMGTAVAGVDLEAGLGAHVLRSLDADTTAFGARVLLEHGRLLAADAFLDLRQSGAIPTGALLTVTASDHGGLVITMS